MITRLLRLVQLLSVRQKLTPREIGSELGVSSRTVFRYVGSLCEAGIPVQFDARSRSYRLGEKSTAPLSECSSVELHLILLGLQLLEPQLEAGYRREVRSLQTRIRSLSPISVGCDSVSEGIAPGGMSSQRITIMAILAAQRLGKDLVVQADGEREPVVLKHAALYFGKKWLVRGMHNGVPHSRALEKISVLQLR